jgi:hypothetical protein
VHRWHRHTYRANGGGSAQAAHNSSQVVEPRAASSTKRNARQVAFPAPPQILNPSEWRHRDMSDQTEPRNGPPPRDGESRGYPNPPAPRNESSDSHHTTNDTLAADCRRPGCRCGYGESAGCQLCNEFYRDWSIVWPSDNRESVGVQLRRRRAASWRCARLACGRRDPISSSRW